MDRIRHYFPDMTPEQDRQMAALDSLYRDWNSKINVISRKDIDNLYLHHVLHSLAIAREFKFTAGTRIIDLGTGGGFPGIPLAIMFPDCRFTLVDSIGKKVRVAEDIARQIGLTNVVCRHERAEEEKDRFDFMVSRGVMPMPDLYQITQRLIDRKSQTNVYPNGIICLKGGDLSGELQKFRNIAEVTPICTLFPDEEYFTEKNIVYVPVR